MKTWFKSESGKLSVILVLIGFFSLYLAFSDSCPIISGRAEFINNILIGFATNIFGIVITISFVQFFIDKSSIRCAKNKEKESILQYNIILSKYINRYLLYYQRIILFPKSENYTQIKKDFSIEDISGLYSPSLFVTDDFSKPTIEMFLNTEIELREYIKREIENVRFEFYPNLLSILISFIEISLSFGYCEAIISNSRLKWKEGKYTDFICNLIKENGSLYLHEFESGSLVGNAIIPYIYLYYLMKNEIEILEKYCSSLENIDKNARHRIQYTF